MSNSVNSIDNTRKKRIYELDVLRAICIILMIVDHFTLFVDFSSGIFGWAKYLFFSHLRNEMLPIKHNLEYASQNLIKITYNLVTQK